MLVRSKAQRPRTFRSVADRGGIASERAATGQPALLVDAHVHWHPCFGWTEFFRAAAGNFASVRRRLDLSASSPGCLLLTESAGVRGFDRLRIGSAGLDRAGWQVESTAETCSVWVRSEGVRILVVAGRQIITAERLEVLALGMEEEIADGMPIRKILACLEARGATAVLPWGFGKWTGTRGRIIADLIEGEPRPRFLLGDNAGRAAFWPRPALFRRAEERGIAVLPGSDPLPLSSHLKRPGSYGFILDNWEESPRPMQGLRARLEEMRRSPRPFGQVSSLAAVLRAQMGIRLYRSAPARETEAAL